VKRIAIAVLLVAAAIGANAATPRTIATANAASCDIGTYAAATLLLPYFEVDFNAPSTEAVTTVFTIVNTSKNPQVARVTIWTDLGFPACYFNVFLTGYDVQLIPMYELIARGNFPYTTSAVGHGPSSAATNPHFNTEIWCDRVGGSVGPNFVRRLQKMLTTGERDEPGCRVGMQHEHAVGYVTVDVVNSCAIDSPLTDAYWKEDILFDNVLTGDYQRINPNTTTGNYAGGNPLVHIRAVPEGGMAGSAPNTPLPYTFYDRYTPRNARHIDRRQPLPATFAARFINGGPGGFNTSYAIWREGVVGPETSECPYEANAKLRLFTPMIVRFDEHENSVVSTGCGEEGCVYPTTGATSAMSSASPVLPPPASSDLAGWIWINLDNGAGAQRDGPYSTRRASQNWIVVQMYAEGRYGVDFDATSIVNGCTASPPTQP